MARKSNRTNIEKTVTICNTDCRIIYSARKTAAIEISESAEIIFRVPKKMKRADIENMFIRHENWIKTKVALQNEKIKQSDFILSPENEKRLRDAAKKHLPERLKYWGNIMKLQPQGIKITAAKKRFGSCNSKNSICFSYMLMLYPQEAIDYVVVHELAHIVHKNHGKSFYALVRKYYPSYKEAEKLLKMPPHMPS